MPTLSPRHIWTPFGSLLEDRFGTHFWSILETVLGLILELIRDSCWNSFGAPKVSRRGTRRHTESPQIRIPTWKASVARFSGYGQAEDGIRDPLWSRGLGDVYKRQHFGAHLERLNYPVEEQEGIRKLRRSVSQPGKLPLHASQVPELQKEPKRRHPSDG